MLTLFFMLEREETVYKSRFCEVHIKLGKKKPDLKKDPLISLTANLQDHSSASL